MPFTPGNTRFRDYITRLFGARGANAGGTVLDDIMPVIDLADDSPDVSYLRGDRRWCLQYSVAAGGAGNYSWVQIGMPAGEPGLLIIEGMQIWKAAAGLVYAWPGSGGPAAYTTTGNRMPLDSRVGPGYPAGIGVSTGAGLRVGMMTSSAIVAAASPGFCVTAPTTPAAGVNQLPFPLVFLPGSGYCLTVQNGTVNEAFNFQFWGRERTADEQETR